LDEAFLSVALSFPFPLRPSASAVSLSPLADAEQFLPTSCFFFFSQRIRTIPTRGSAQSFPFLRALRFPFLFFFFVVQFFAGVVMSIFLPQTCGPLALLFESGAPTPAIPPSFFSRSHFLTLEKVPAIQNSFAQVSLSVHDLFCPFPIVFSSFLSLAGENAPARPALDFSASFVVRFFSGFPGSAFHCLVFFLKGFPLCPRFADEWASFFCAFSSQQSSRF